ncbi:MAG: hypothetical protein JRJ77_10455 [Deltaproteobacteria bacterium]|nr:hypothetical protein [Deltaproteobacteria bacterium]
MKQTGVVITAFGISIALSLLAGTLLLLNVKAIPNYTRMIDTGKQILESVLGAQLQEKNYLLYHQKDALDNVKDKVGNLRKLLSFYEKSRFAEKRAELFKLADWEEAMNLYERLFDQFVVYHEAVEKNIAAIRDLEKSILAVIYSKMNPERGIIGLQEIRIHEKGYLIYRNYPEPPDERPFKDKRKEAVSNLLMWAHKDKRIEELMDKDNQLFNEIIKNYESQDQTLVALKRENGKIEKIGERFLEEGKKELYIIYRRCVFLCIILLIMWVIMAIAIVSARFR